MQPFANGQHLTVTHYNEGDAYELHVDSAHTVGRVATALIFIKQPVAGGELVFPWARTDTLRTSAARPAGVTGVDGQSRSCSPRSKSRRWTHSAPATTHLRTRPFASSLALGAWLYFSTTIRKGGRSDHGPCGSCPVRGGEKRSRNASTSGMRSTARTGLGHYSTASRRGTARASKLSCGGGRRSHDAFIRCT